MNRGGGKARTFQKPKNRKYVLKRLWDYLMHYKWLILLALILTILSNLFALIGPSLLGEAIDAMDIEKNGFVDLDKVFYYATLMVIFYILSSIFSYSLSRLMITSSRFFRSFSSWSYLCFAQAHIQPTIISLPKRFCRLCLGVWHFPQNRSPPCS